MTEDERALRARAEAACVNAEPDWATMFSGEQEARVASWIEGYRTAAQEHFDMSAGMNAMLRINAKLLARNAMLAKDAAAWREHNANMLAAGVMSRGTTDSSESGS